MAKKADQVEIELKALGERSALTGKVTLARGAKITVSADAAAEAVATGRWAYVAAPEPEAAPES